MRHLAPDPARPKKGRKVNLNWRTDFLADLEAHGGLYHAAKVAGIDSTTVYDEYARNPAFKQHAEEARQRFADSQEQQLQELGKQGNVVGPIVLLKKHRPMEYVEKALTIQASFSTQLDPAAGQALLQTMLGQLPQSVLPALPAQGDNAQQHDSAPRPQE